MSSPVIMLFAGLGGFSIYIQEAMIPAAGLGGPFSRIPGRHRNPGRFYLKDLQDNGYRKYG
jgi:hypothetical protein